MYNNGVTHMSVNSDMAGSIQAILKWMSYLPATSKSPLPIYVTDPVDRDVEYTPPAPPSPSYDPRWMMKV